MRCLSLVVGLCGLQLLDSPARAGELVLQAREHRRYDDPPREPARFSADGRFVFTGGVTWCAVTGARLGGHPLPDGDHLVETPTGVLHTHEEPRALVFRRPRTGEVVQTLRTPYADVRWSWSANGARALAVRRGGLDIYDTGTGNIVARIEVEHARRAWLSPDGSRIAIPARLGVRIVGVVDGAEVATLPLPEGSRGLRSVQWSPDGGQLLVTPERGTSRIFAVPTRSRSGSPPRCCTGPGTHPTGAGSPTTTCATGCRSSRRPPARSWRRGGPSPPSGGCPTARACCSPTSARPCAGTPPPTTPAGWWSRAAGSGRIRTGVGWWPGAPSVTRTPVSC